MSLSYYQNKTVLITGAASGIGAELTKQLHTAGAKQILLDINQDGLKELTESLSKERPFDGKSYTTDVTNESEMLKTKDDILNSIGIPDIIIANAGVGGVNPASCFSLDLNRKIMEINYFGTINTLIPFIPELLKKGQGHLVGVLSLAALRGLPLGSSYCASKSAQSRLMQSLATELIAKNISVSAIYPGFVKTLMLNHDEFQTPFSVTPEKAAKTILVAIKKKKTTHHFPWPMAILSKLNTLIPDKIYNTLIPKLSPPPKNPKPKLFTANPKK